LRKDLRSIQHQHFTGKKTVGLFQASIGHAESLRSVIEIQSAPFTGDFSTNPPTSPTDGFSYNLPQAEFAHGNWTITPTTVFHFTFNDPPRQFSFTPRVLHITGTLSDGTTGGLTVNGIPILLQDHHLKDNISEGLVEVFLPELVFLGGKNTIELNLTSGSLTFNKVEVLISKDVVDPYSDLELLKKMLARMGHEIALMKNDWNSLIFALESALNLHPLFPPLLDRAKVLTDRFSDISSDTSLNVRKLQSFCSDFYANQMVILLDAQHIFPTKTKQDQLQWIFKQAEESKKATNTLRDKFLPYHTDLLQFKADLVAAVQQAEKEIDLEQKLADIRVQINETVDNINKEQDKFNGALIGLGVQLVIGVVVALLGPLILLIPAAIGVGLSLAAMVKASKRIDELNAQLDVLYAQEQELIDQNNKVRALLHNITDIADSLDDFAAQVVLFDHMWKFLQHQLDGIQALNLFDKQGLPPVWDGEVYAKNLQPYFINISDVLKAYLASF